MAPNDDSSLTGKQIQQLADGLLDAFTDFKELARVVRVALDVRLNRIVDQQADFEDQVWELIEWVKAKGRIRDLFRDAVRSVPGNDRLRKAVVEVLGESALGDSLVVGHYSSVG
jgi:hypothetical protein